jgi:hypothetical protein
VEREIDLDWLLRVRLVARCGEMDAPKWWNTNGQLGPYGAKVLGKSGRWAFAEFTEVYNLETGFAKLMATA